MLYFFKEKEKLELEKRNYELWLQGIYIRSAIVSAFGSGKNQYPEKPIRITEMTEEEKEAERKRIIERWREALNEQTRRWNARKGGG